MTPSTRRWRPVALAAAALAATATGETWWALSGRDWATSLGPAELALVLSLVGAALIWLRPGHRVAWLVCCTGVAFSVAVLGAGALVHGGSAGWPGPLLQTALAACWAANLLALPWALLLLWFPDGDWAGPRWRRAVIVLAPVACVVVGIGWLLAPAGPVPGLLGGVPVPQGVAGPLAGTGAGPWRDLAGSVTALPVLALPALVGRYRRSSTRVRRQIGLVVAAGAVAVVGTIAAIMAGGPTSPVGLAVLLLTQPLPALAIAVAILRHQLWGVEVVVSRTLVHVVLWAVVSTVFLVPAALSGALVGGGPAMSAVLVALLVTLAFQPVRDRLERWVEAVVYRHRPRGYALLARLGAELEQAVDVPALARRTVSGVRDGLGVRWAELWVAQEYGDHTALRLAGSTDAAGSDAVRRVLLDAGACESLRSGTPPPALWDEPPALVVPVVTGDSFLGVLACGDRPGDPLRTADAEVLGVIARDCALALHTRRLESQLRDRLDEIEAQAGELRRSRERIVSAQDAERRRIGRDLHDGVQQHVLGLVMALRSAAPDLRALADDAETLVFELQDLARGIFPSALVDHGLEEALRSQIGRNPGQVRLDVAPAVAGLRVEPAVESAAWFIVLEALANAAKHAPGSPVTVTLDGAGDRLLVEVHDHGPGFDRTRVPLGHGLQNMADRAEAVGGSCTIDSRAGRGTWVRVELPRTAQVVALPQPGLP